MANPKISIIIPSYNEEEQIGDLFESIKKQKFQDYEVIVSDSGSTDNTAKIAKSYGAKVITGPKRGPGAGRNLGAKEARGDILVFFDADVRLVEEDILKSIEELFKRRTDVVGGTTRYGAKDGALINRLIYKIGEIVHPIFFTKGFVPGFSHFVQKESFEKIGGFNENLQAGEDIDLGSRLIKVGKMVTLKQKVLASSRRLTQLGWTEVLKTCAISAFCNIFKKNNPKSIIFKPASGLKGKE
ncbi:MAG: glycosyltransferase [Candidatus Nanoarchaeia archaeon]|nr:glycosyltransferase [Candidatus Nanoarchaeia archaeon]MDD5238995.1 glycosyltransferase [Candidatus Nanoarchaeia archaeon]